VEIATRKCFTVPNSVYASSFSLGIKKYHLMNRVKNTSYHDFN